MVLDKNLRNDLAHYKMLKLIGNLHNHLVDRVSRVLVLRSGSTGLAVAAILEARDVSGSVLSWGGPGAIIFEHEGSELSTEVTHLTPVLTPAVANMPVGTLLLILAPTDDGDDVINAVTCLSSDTTGVLEDLGSIDTTGDWSTGHDLLLHVGCSTD